jgi:hypothetical protein
MARLSSGPVRGSALFERRRFSAVFFTAGMRTDRGIGAGSTTKALTTAYGAARLLFMAAGNSPAAIHVYTPGRDTAETAQRFASIRNRKTAWLHRSEWAAANSQLAPAAAEAVHG